MTPPKTHSVILTVEEATEVCRQIRDTAEGLPGYIDALREAGFEAFDPFEEFVESFCDNERELETHRKYRVELGKTQLSDPYPLNLTLEELHNRYVSPFIRQLRNDLVELNGGVSLDSTLDGFPGELWREESSPCERRRVKWMFENQEIYEARWQAVRDDAKAILEGETERHASGLARQFTLEPKGRIAFYKAAMARDAGAYGFVFDKVRSKSGNPVFSKQISDNWSLAIAIKDRDLFFYTPFEGRLELDLWLVSASSRGSVDNGKQGEGLLLRIFGLLPGFIGAYWQFHSLDEMETIIKFHMQLYGLMAPSLEKGIASALNGIAAGTQ